MIGRAVGHHVGDPVAIVFVELGVTGGIDLIDVLGLANKQRGHLLRSHRPGSLLFAGLKRFKDRFGATGGRAVARNISALEKVTIKARGRQRLAIRLRSFLHRLDVQLRIADSFGLVQIFSSRAPAHLDRIGSQTLTGSSRIVRA